MTFVVYPAIDVRDGRVVRLNQGDFARETRYDAEPLALAQAYAAAGAAWLHLVDLDAARNGGYTLAPLVSRIKASTGLRVQSGGGVRDEAGLSALLDAGVDRAVLGSVAVSDTAAVSGWLAHYGPERIAVALDARLGADGHWWPATHGWTRAAATTLDDLVRNYADSGLRHLLCTDIERDGMLSGPNLGLYDQVRDCIPGLALQASGGVRDAADVAAARAAGCAGIVLGRALLEGRLDLADALRMEADAC